MEDKEQPRTRNRQACHHMVKQQEISLIACIAQNGAIGFHNHLLYPIRQDMQRFILTTPNLLTSSLGLISLQTTVISAFFWI